jgi:hypothetical protein
MKMHILIRNACRSGSPSWRRLALTAPTDRAEAELCPSAIEGQTLADWPPVLPAKAASHALRSLQRVNCERRLGGRQMSSAASTSNGRNRVKKTGCLAM